MFYRRHTTSQDDEPYHILGVTGLSAVHQRENGLEPTVISLSERKCKARAKQSGNEESQAEAHVIY